MLPRRTIGRPDQREGQEPGERWEGNLGNTIGPQLILGIAASDSSCLFGPCIDLVWRYVPIQLPETPTGVTPDSYSKHMIELHFSAQFAGFIF